MCGIVGYIGKQEVLPILIDGLKRLEYRGYDSAGVAVVNKDGRLDVRRSVGKLKNLESALEGKGIKGSLGIGHTRWATHGRPSEENAHPHRAGGIVVVHNGIIENYIQLKNRLIKEGCKFTSETDTEVICHLVNMYSKKGNGLEEAVRKALKDLHGSYAIGVINENEPDVLIGARNGSPLVAGIGNGEYFIASDIPAILNHTRDVIFLDDNEMIILRQKKYAITDMDGMPVEKEINKVMWNPVMAEKGGYKHFMLKEIHEQPRAIMDTIRGRISQETGHIYLDEMKLSEEEIKGLKKVMIVACGTSWHAGLTGKFIIEELVRLPVEVDIASEFRYRNPIVDKDTLFLAISQSGETADTLAALREAKKNGAKVVSICNVVGSTITRESDGIVYTHAGPEIGVASTKAFTTQLTALFLLAVYFGVVRGKIDGKYLKELLKELVHLPLLIEDALKTDKEIEGIASAYFNYRDFLYLGRGINYPIALEGALKLKEISYIHAEGYPAGEMKHGPIALIDEDMPVVVLTADDKVYEKVLSNIMEVKARGGKIIAIASEGDKEIAKKVDSVLYIPRCNHFLTPILLSIPLQLLAYHVAVLRGSDVDQPRNLAKSVTVE
ncbi:MAG: glutamine--fructose-6-phosphate transaminase (isomerizing) [Nitrospirae bacterium]|nr:glutamine--fructose-6-phosphate transaminase (isomerizing) [Nitrospirota bacterium]